MAKIVAYTNLYVPHCRAGAQTMLRDMLRPLVTAGHDVEVLLGYPNQGDRPYDWEGATVYPATDKRLPLHHIPRADLVITHMEFTERAALLANRYNIPVVQVFHNDRPATFGYLAYRCDLAVYNTEWIAERFRDKHAGPSLVVHPPVNPKEYHAVPGRKVTLVNLWPNKGSDLFYKLVEAMPDVEFLGVRGGYGEQDVRTGIANLETIGQTDDMRGEVYEKTKILLMPSKYESFGRVAIEAAASGIPTIAHPTPGLRESLGRSGIFVDRDDVDAWVAEINRLMSPRGYGKARQVALSRSRELAEMSRIQMEDFTRSVDLLLSQGKTAWRRT